MGDSLLTVIKKADRNNDILDYLTVWFNEAKNGQEVLENIKAQLEVTV